MAPSLNTPSTMASNINALAISSLPVESAASRISGQTTDPNHVHHTLSAYHHTHNASSITHMPSLASRPTSILKASKYRSAHHQVSCTMSLDDIEKSLDDIDKLFDKAATSFHTDDLEHLTHSIAELLHHCNTNNTKAFTPSATPAATPSATTPLATMAKKQAARARKKEAARARKAARVLAQQKEASQTLARQKEAP